MSDIYTLQAPNRWADAPQSWSSTSIEEVTSCPLRWQLLNSEWGSHPRFPVRQHPAAVEGQIVHSALDDLAKACGRRGNPAIGSAPFQAALAEADFFRAFTRRVSEWNGQMANHPRPGPAFVLRCDPQELANRAIRLFREQYRPGTGVPAPAHPQGLVESAPSGPALVPLLRTRGSLQELRLTHPVEPFKGVIDRVVWADGTVEIVDFKTGAQKDSHRSQLQRYAVLWWRCTGKTPARITAQYLDGARSWDFAPGDLVGLEQRLVAEIKAASDSLLERPAKAHPGSGCGWCPVRARCGSGWAASFTSAGSEGVKDVEVTLTSAPGLHGFVGRGPAKGETAVVYEAPIAPLLPPVWVGQTVRLLDAVVRQKATEVEIKPWTEVYLCQT